jgi:hypothetical protein
MTTDPTLAAGADILDEALVAMRAVVEGAPAELLNRRPAGDDTNTVAVLVMHALSSARWWLCVAVGAALTVTRSSDTSRPTQTSSCSSSTP